MANPNLFVWTSDWHVVSDASEHGLVNQTHPAEAAALAAHIASLEPAGVLDTGDCKDHYGASSGDELDRYVESVASVLPAMLRLPGNHDEVLDAPAGSNDFSLYDARLGGAPYHGTLDWPAARVRFIALHSYVHHSTDGFAGFAHVDSSEVAFVAAEIAALPDGWQAIVCSHFPLNPLFGAFIHFIDATYTYASPHPLLVLLAANSSRVCAYLNGHRHGNMEVNVRDGIPHLNGPGVAYTLGNGDGGISPIVYDGATRTLTFGFNYAKVPPYSPVPGYTPLVVQLPPLPVDPNPQPVGFAFDVAGSVTIDGVPHAGAFTGTGTFSPSSELEA